jgi:hypothetical protein
MSDVEMIIRRARDLSLRLRIDGDRIEVKGRCPSDLLEQMRLHKPALMAFLEAEAAHHQVTPDRAPWIHVAVQIIFGEFDGCDRSTHEALIIGLRSVDHILAKRALQRLRCKAPNRDQQHQ